MARGSVVGEKIVSMAATPEYEAGHQRIFGKVRVSARGRWVWDEDAGKLVPAGEYRPKLAKNALIISDRIHEGTVSPVDGSSIGSRAKRRAHMKEHDLIDRSDFSAEYRERETKWKERQDDRARKAAMHEAARKLYREGKWE